MLRRNISLVLLVLILLFSTTGCTKYIGNQNRVLMYLYDKYNDTFYVDEAISPSYDTNYYEYHCHSNTYPNREFVVYAGNEIKDNYFDVLLNESNYFNKFENIVSKHIKNFKLYHRQTSNFFDNNIVDVNDIDKYIKNSPEQFFTDIFIYTNSEPSKSSVEKIIEEFKKEIPNFYIQIVSVSDNELKHINTLNTLDEVLNKYYKNDILFSKVVK